MIKGYIKHPNADVTAGGATISVKIVDREGVRVFARLRAICRYGHSTERYLEVDQCFRPPDPPLVRLDTAGNKRASQYPLAEADFINLEPAIVAVLSRIGVTLAGRWEDLPPVKSYTATILTVAEDPLLSNTIATFAHSFDDYLPIYLDSREVGQIKHLAPAYLYTRLIAYLFLEDVGSGFLLPIIENGKLVGATLASHPADFGCTPIEEDK